MAVKRGILTKISPVLKYQHLIFCIIYFYIIFTVLGPRLAAVDYEGTGWVQEMEEFPDRGL